MWSDKKESILLVDDEEDLLSIWEALFEAENFEVLKAANGKLALEVLEKRKNTDGRPQVDLIVSDFDMPEMNGRELLLQVRERGWNSIAFIMVSGKVTREQLTQLMTEGVDGVFVKPIEHAEVVERGRAAMKSRSRKHSA